MGAVGRDAWRSPLMKTNAVKMSGNVRGFGYDFYRLETLVKNDWSK